MRLLATLRCLCALALFAAGGATVQADNPEKPAEAERRVETRHGVTIGGERIEYTATAGKMLVGADESGKARASVFYIAYTVETDGAPRPLAFCFNGGPGSSSVWLHLGAFGPRRVKLGDEGLATPPPYELAENPHSILDVADLVFIDPVSTGYSRPEGEAPAKAFHGLKEDVRSVGEFVRLYVTRNERWGSPKFLAGESYGALRAAALAAHLQDEQGMYLNGVVLVSPVLNYQTISFHPGNDLPYALVLPSYTATAHFHGRLGPEAGELDDALREAEAFASSELLTRHFAGDALPSEERAEAAARFASLSGLSEKYVSQNRVRVPPWRFSKEMLRDEGKTVGRFDARYTGFDRDDAGEAPEYDPSYAEVHGAFATLLKDYVRAELDYETDTPYEILAGEEVRPWDFAPYVNRYTDVSDSLRQAMTKNPHLRALFLAGYYDLATPYFATEYTVNHLNLPEAVRGNAKAAYYRSGHMVYLRERSLEKMKADVARFIADALPGGEPAAARRSAATGAR